MLSKQFNIQILIFYFFGFIKRIDKKKLQAEAKQTDNNKEKKKRNSKRQIQSEKKKSP